MQISDADRQQLNDTSLPLANRLWGTKHHVRENIGIPTAFRLLQGVTGTDPYAIDITFISPEECGFDMNEFDPAKETVVCADSGMRHYVRETATGVELRTRFYAGYVKKDGKFVRVGSSAPVSIEAGQNHHMIKEFTKLGELPPRPLRRRGPQSTLNADRSQQPLSRRAIARAVSPNQ